jgi:PAS domain S-box-containing protein
MKIIAKKAEPEYRAPSVATERPGSIEQARLAAVVDSSHDAIISKTLEGCIQTWNAAAERLFGYPAAEVIGESITIIIPPELQAEEQQILQRLSRGERIDHFETIRLTKDGRRIPVSLTVSPVRDAEGRIVGASKIARDISERRRADHLLRQTQAQLEAHANGLAKLNECSARLWSYHTLKEGLNEILNAVVELLGADHGTIQLLDEAGLVLEVAAQRGFSSDFLVLFREAVSADGSASVRALRGATRIVIADVETDPCYEPLLTMARAAGIRGIVSTPLLGPDGTTFGVLSTHFAAAHVPNEQEMRLLDMFVRHVCDFIRRCQMEQSLRVREESLRDGARRKDEFLALLAHELRNPLAPVRYALATIKRPGLSSEQRARANEIIERQVVHMSRLLDDLLDVSRITRGAIELRKRRTELKLTIDAAVDAARPVIEVRQHHLTIDLPEPALLLEADPVRLTQVFTNLLINAAKYTDTQGAIHIKVAREQNEAVVSIRDNGIGIAADMMPRLFTLFSQAHSAPDRPQEGLGVGLALVRELVTLHGGRIDVRSEGLHRGSEFIVRLPCISP